MKETRKTVKDYGRFNEKEGCFHLKAPPPRKWINLHYNQPGEHEVYAEITNIGDGPVTVRDGAGCTCQLVGYDSKYLYIRDEESGTVFCPGGEPAPQKVTGVSTRYYAGKTETTGTCKKLRATQRVFVPEKEIFEAWTLTLENRDARERKVSIFAYAMFQLTGKGPMGEGVWKDNSSEIHPEACGVFVKNRERSVPNGRFNGYLVTLNKEEFAGASGYRDFFTRSSFSMGDPKILWGWNCDNRPFRGPDCAGIVQVTVTIPPKGTKRADFLLGQAADVEEIKTVLARTTPESLDAACAEQMRIERERAAKFTVNTGHPEKDALINIFVKKQLVSYLINKSGFRDNMQNNMGVALFDYPMARANILRAVSSQYENGSVPHGFRPFNLLQYADKPAWLLHCIPWVIKESGDFGLLDEPVPYFQSARKETVWQHMLRAMRFLANDTGAHGLCDQHHADWNDGLEPSEKTGARESVMVTQQLCLGLREVEELARRRNEADIEREASELYGNFSRRLNEVAWDGEWYARTICGSGYKLGSNEHAEGKIFMNPQSWAVLSGIASPERARLCMEAVDRLIETDYGFSIAAPAYTQFDERVGKFSASRPYLAENGGCYNHAAGFKGVADCMLGRAEEAWRTFIKVTPGSPWNPAGNSRIEPFSYTNCYSITPEWPGMSMYPWRTGTANWFTMLLVEWILGARRHYDGLLIDPCLSKEVPKAKMVRTFRGARYEINIDNTAGRCKGVTSLKLDGKKIKGNLLPAPHEGAHKVKVVV